MDQSFKRINYFTGQFLTAEDLKQAQDYHLAKRRLHNKCLHTPGVVEGCLEKLVVTALDDGLGVHVAPGYALDAEGRDLYLPERAELPLSLENYPRPATVYVTIQYDEQKIEERHNRVHQDYTGHAFIREYPKVSITSEEPDNTGGIELARIELSNEATRVNNPRDAENPGPNEIDRRHVLKVGAQRGHVSIDDIGVLVDAAITDIAASKKDFPSEQDPYVTLDKFDAKEVQHRFYTASVYPLENGQISWRIESFYKNGEIEYRLFFRNPQPKAVKVAYRIYRLN